jgi:hypothetical protein
LDYPFFETPCIALSEAALQNINDRSQLFERRIALSLEDSDCFDRCN